MAGETKNLFELTSEEVIALALGLGLPIPRFVDRERYEAWPEPLRNAIATAGLRTLAARDLVREVSGTLQVPERVATLMHCLAHPGLVAETRATSAGRSEDAFFYATPTWVSGHRLTPMGNHRFTLFAAEHLLEALLAASGVAVDDDGPAVSVDEEVSLEDLLTGTSTGTAIANVLRDPDTVAGSVAAVCPDPDGVVVGGEVAWLRTGDGVAIRLDRFEDPGGGHRWRGRSCTTQDIVLAVRGLLPDIDMRSDG